MTDRPIELAKNRAAHLLAAADADLEAGAIDEAEWYRRVGAAITPSYLAADTPWAQSGKSGDAASFERARRLLVDAMRPGCFLDVGCASGYLMECMQTWCAEAGIACEPYGLDIEPALAELARSRLPHWRDRIFTGNAIDWQPPQRFDVVRTGLEYVPTRRQRDFVTRLLADVVADGGRLVIGVFSEERDDHAMERQLETWGFAVTGRSQRLHADPRLAYRVVWIDR
ncbi:MAG TPA: class I SAM-dependent methyltransferase [Kofleriaceae bacterium]|nr:class I SAM-dependent methyltransferase [Kofleriaceae bacterium]